MRERRWRAGQSFEMAGLMFRVVQGYKNPDDLRLEWQVERTWIAIPMSVGLMMADFFYENEDVLYPPPKRGGAYYLDYVRVACRSGWTKAQAGIRAAQAAADARRHSLFGEAS